MLWMILTSLEVLAINLVVTFFCTKQKYSMLVNVLVLLVTTVLLYVFSYFVIGLNSGPSIWGIVLGFVFVLPLYLLLDIKIYKLVYIMTMSWLYTLVVSGTSQLLGSMWFTEYELLFSLLIQTLLFLATITFMIRFVKEKVLFLLTKMQRNWATLLLFSTSVFTITVVIRYYSSFSVPYLQIIVLLLLLIGSYLFHQVFFLLFQNKLSLVQAHEIAYTDSLTQTGNRYALFQTIESLIQKQTAFELVFLDLDQFKRVNDQFSHIIGDHYLRHFASIVANHIQPFGTVYRFAGDEFICVLTHITEDFDLPSFASHITTQMNRAFEFYGVSMGVSRYPQDGTTSDALIEVADQRMYADKGYRDTENLPPKTRTL